MLDRLRVTLWFSEILALLVRRDRPAAFWPYLVFGQWTHVGGGTTVGLGRYRIEAGGAGVVATEDGS